jgi:AAA domain
MDRRGWRLIRSPDAWTLRRLLCGEAVNGELQAVSEPFRRLADMLATLPLQARQGAWDGFLCGQSEPDALVKALAAADPLASCPEADETNSRPATLADVRKIMAEAQWLWNLYIPAARIVGIAAYEGIGKTRFATDLARRIWFALPWPDGQPATLPQGTPTLWVCADGQHDDLAAAVEALGLPDEAIVFNTTADEPYGGTELDTTEDRDRLEGFIRQVRPGLVFIDTLTNATSFDLCRATENKAMMTPIRDIAQRTQTTIIPLLHLSKEGQALGRRIKGMTRTILQLDCPDPEQSGRLRLAVTKSFAKKPPSLGVTMTDAGNDYDHTPPTVPAPGKPGRPAESRDKAERFICDALTLENDQIGNDLRAEWEKSGESGKTFWRAVDVMAEAGTLVKDGGRGTGKQIQLHLIGSKPEPDPTTAF